MKKVSDKIKEKSRDRVFGNVMFGDKANDPRLAKLQGAKPGSEPNTEEEDILYAALKTWTVSPDMAIDDLFKFKNSLKSAMNKFPELLKPLTPNGTILYRGLRNISPYIKDQINNSNPNNWVKLGYHYLLKTPIDYIPRSPIQSWTPEFGSGDMFAEKALLITRQNSEFIFNQKLFKILYGLNEKEVLHFDNKYSGRVYIAVNDYLISKFYKRHKEITNTIKGSVPKVSSTLKEKI